MKKIDDSINNLEQIKDKSSLKVFLEEYKKMYAQLSEERDYRIRVIENLRQELLSIRKNNLKIIQSDNYKKIKEKHNEEIKRASNISLVYHGIYGCSKEDATKKYQEKMAELTKQFSDELTRIGYIQEEIVFGQEYEIENYIKSLYRKYVCEDFGHEYARNEKGNVEVFREGFRGPKYEVDAFERHTGKILDAGSPGIPTVQCKCCGEKIYGDIFQPDFKDKQKILLPISELKNECK